MRRFKGFTIIELMIVVAILGILLALVVGAGGRGCRGDFWYKRTVEGRVVTTPQGRLAPAGESYQQKFAIKLNPYRADPLITEIAAGPSGLMIECLSTRCAQVEVGSCQRFVCRRDARWNEPWVVACKHDREIACLAKSDGL